jgi:hypothetical protein
MPKISKPQPEPRQCLFCDRNANSPEHMWSDWMRPYFKRTAHDSAAETFQRLAESQQHIPTGRVLHGHPTTRKIKAVCRVCNTGWMSRLETAAKPFLEPMIQGKRVVLSRDAQRILMEWVILKMMVWEMTDPRGKVFTREETLAFAASRTLPATLRIWLFRTRIPNFAHITRAFVALFVAGDPSAIKNKDIPNTQTVLFGIGQLVIYVLQSNIPALDLSKHSQRFAKRVWPIFRADMPWPPMGDLNATEIRYLGTTLSRYLGRVGFPI